MTQQEKLIHFVAIVGKTYKTKYEWRSDRRCWYIFSYHYNSSNLRRASLGINFMPSELEKLSPLALESIANNFVRAMTKQVKSLY